MTSPAQALPTRSAIDKRYTWNAESVFPTPSDWEQTAESILRMLPEVQAYQGRLAESADTLADYFNAAENVVRTLYKVYVYAGMSSAVDNTDPAANAMQGRAASIAGQVEAALAFERPELVAIGHETLRQWMGDEPRLARYGQYFDDLFRQAAHVRSAEVEQILGMLSDPFRETSRIYSMLVNSDLAFSPAVGEDEIEQPVAQSTINGLLSSPDRELRRTAFERYGSAYLSHQNTLTSSYLTYVKQQVFIARARGFGSTLEASLFDNNIPVEVFHNLIDTYKRNIPTWHKYWSVRRRVLGYDELHPYDIWAPMTQNEPHVPYEQAVDWICEGMQPLGTEYVDAMRRGCLEDRWVDVYPNQGKRIGAFSSGSYDTMPFIMMSYSDSLGAMSTLAHELGHSMHSYLSRGNQPYIYAGYSLFVAEVASNFNQALTRSALNRSREGDKDFQIALIQEAMTNFHRYFFIMPNLARFEMEIHARVEQGKGLTANDLNSLAHDLFAEGYGSDMQTDGDLTGIIWAQFQHLYANFYVYQYATGIAAAHALADAVLTEGKPAAQRYREFLKLGSSVYPLDALKHAGVDMTTPAAVEKTFEVLAGLVDQLEQLTGV